MNVPLLVIGGACGEYPNIYQKVATLAEKANFYRSAEDLRVSISDAAMDKIIYSESARFYRQLKGLAGDLPDNTGCAKDNCCSKKRNTSRAKSCSHPAKAPSERTGSDAERIDT